MMQMLAAGGMPILTDGERAPDTDNPRGYCEWEPAKLLPKNPELIAQAEGKAVKVISQLLLALPLSHEYRIVFMQRPLTEVVASQEEMIKRRGLPVVVPAAQMMAALENHLKQVKGWLRGKSNIALHYVEHRDVVERPAAVCTTLRDFLSFALDVEAMQRQVDPGLYRQRAPSTNAG
jgi:hypothetical protein